ncbi:MAG: hypothetical protein CMH96_03995 [Oceanospirillaceae bacterium]|nr:hypothetical protein [Oceanospirillaceae bacterium]HCI02305.1 YaiI/YqxD family protein [Oceanospirillaceae bacterium]|tara:strand:+ start:816 stop:1274 length:459 start_codon:yes stop_codon:yes gene_type:complete
MTVWVDADACPVVVREILCRAAERTQIPTVFVANQFISTPPSKVVRMLQVSSGFDEADNEIVKRVQAGDLVITSDIPLAAEIIAKGATALNNRGETYTKANIKAKLNMRDFMETMRSSGVQTGGPAAYSHADRMAFANKLDQWQAKQKQTHN